MAIVGVPKTIDNDILLMDKTFGFDTAVEEAQRAINSAYIEVQIKMLFIYQSVSILCSFIVSRFFSKICMINLFSGIKTCIQSSFLSPLILF